MVHYGSAAGIWGKPMDRDGDVQTENPSTIDNGSSSRSVAVLREEVGERTLLVLFFAHRVGRRIILTANIVLCFGLWE